MHTFHRSPVALQSGGPGRSKSAIVIIRGQTAPFLLQATEPKGYGTRSVEL